MEHVTVRIDSGAISVKAVAADASGEVLSRARIPHWGRVSHRLESRAGHAAGAEGRYRRFREGADR